MNATIIAVTVVVSLGSGYHNLARCESSAPATGTRPVAAVDSAGDTPLHIAARWGRTGEVIRLCESGIDVNVRNRWGETPLHKAAAWRHAEVCRTLLVHGAKANVSEEFGNTPLNRACAVAQSLHVVQVLLEHGADPNLCNREKSNALHKACSWAGRVDKSIDAELVELLLEHEARVNAQDYLKQTPLHMVANVPNGLEPARLLLNAGADPNIRDVNGLTAVDTARRAKQGAIVGLLLQHGGRETIHAAVARGALDAVERMLDENPKLLKQPAAGGLMPLHVAARHGLTQVAGLLIERGAHVNDVCSLGTPLHVAAAEGQLKVAELLLSKGGDPNIRAKLRTEMGSLSATPLELALSNAGGWDMADVLASHGATYGVFEAAWAGWEDRLKKKLAAAPRDVNRKGLNGMTALHTAGLTGSATIARILLDHGADVSAKDRYGATPLHYAVVHDCTEVAALLLAHGARTDVRDRAGRTALDAAEDDAEMLALLMRKDR